MTTYGAFGNHGGVGGSSSSQSMVDGVGASSRQLPYHAAPRYAVVLPPWVKRYPCIAHAILPTSHLFHQAQQAYEREHEWGHSHLEVELRFGQLRRNELRPGVSAGFLQRAFAAANEYKTWFSVTDWELSTDFHYHLAPSADSFNPRGTPVRTTVQLLSEAEMRRRGLEHPRVVTHVNKSVLHRQDFKYSPTLASSSASSAASSASATSSAASSATTGPTATPAAGFSHADIRVAVSVERHIDEDQLPRCVEKPAFVRIKNRRRFMYRPEDCTDAHVAYDFTLSWSGASYAEAEQKMQRDETAFELEIEILHLARFMRIANRDPVDLAASLLLKAADFVGPTQSFAWHPIASMSSNSVAVSHTSMLV